MAKPRTRTGDGTIETTTSSPMMKVGLHRFTLTIIALIIMVLVFIVAALAIPDPTSEDPIEAPVEATGEVDRVMWEVSIVLEQSASSSLSYHLQEGTIDTDELEDLVWTDMTDLIDAQMSPYPDRVKGYETTVDLIDVTIMEGGAELELPGTVATTTNDVSEVPGSADLSYLAMDDVRVPGLYSLDVDFEIELRSVDGSNITTLGPDADVAVTREGEVTSSIFVPMGALEAIAGRFEYCAQTRYSDVASMVNYMLNVMARYRASMEWGLNYDDSPRNILNEGDVEIALNTALLIEQLMLTGSYDPALVAEMDQNFFYVSLPADAETPVNPSNHREWSASERANFVQYQTAMQAVNPLGRAMKNLILDYDSGGYLDAADLFTLYLCMDNMPWANSLTVDPNDDTSILIDRMFMDARFPTYLLDMNNLIFRAPIPDDGVPMTSYSGPIELSMDNGKVTESSNKDLQVQVDQTPNYLVASKDFIIEGAFPPHGWYTTGWVNSTLYGASPCPGEGTRCGGVKPNVPPPEHDFRVQWDMNIRGSLQVNLSLLEDDDQFLLDGKAPEIIQEIELDFPVTVLCWLPKRPNNEVIIFENINKGTMFQNLTASIWIIEPQANATEFFVEKVWRTIKPIVAVAWDEVAMLNRLALEFNAQGGTSRMDTQADVRALALRAMTPGAYQAAIDMSSPWEWMSDFLDGHVYGQNITTDKIAEMAVSMSNVTVDYDLGTDLMTVVVEHNRYDPQGAILTMKFTGIKNEANRAIDLTITSKDNPLLGFSLAHTVLGTGQVDMFDVTYRHDGDVYDVDTTMSSMALTDLITSKYPSEEFITDPANEGMIAIPVVWTHDGANTGATIWVGEDVDMTGTLTELNSDIAALGTSPGPNAVDAVLGRLWKTVAKTNGDIVLGFDDEDHSVMMIYAANVDMDMLEDISVTDIPNLAKSIGVNGMTSTYTGIEFITSMEKMGSDTLFTIRPADGGMVTTAYIEADKPYAETDALMVQRTIKS